MKGGIGQLMKQAQQMQADMQKAQEEMASLTVTGESGAGMVRITLTCKYQVKALVIDDALVGEDKEMLEDVVIAAFNDAVRKVESTFSSTPMQEETRLADERIEVAKATLEADPNVRALKDMFGAELKVDSIELLNPPASD